MKHNEKQRDEGSFYLCSTLPAAAFAAFWPRMAGFSFTEKAWGTVDITSLSEIRFDDHAFEQRLVLPPPQKRLIKAIAEYGGAQVAQSKPSTMHCKGSGVTILFHGPSGCGKSFAAEALAEMQYKPLYVVSVGELGTTPASLEVQLQSIMDTVFKWKALVLLEEADLFLERRTQSGNLLQSAMVSAVLRILGASTSCLFPFIAEFSRLNPSAVCRFRIFQRRTDPDDKSGRFA